MYILINRDLNVKLSDNTENRQFWKQICLFGEYINPNGGGKMVLDKNFAEQIVKNFESGEYGVVAVPLGHPKTDIELAELNRGEVKKLKITESGIDALIEIRDEETAKKIENRLIPDVSMGFSENYLDKKTGRRVGALLKHVGLVVDPYIKGMTQFVACGEVGASVLFSDKEVNQKEGEKMNLVEVKNNRDFDVEVKYLLDNEEVVATIKAGEKIEIPEDQVEAVKEQIEKAEAPKSEEESEEVAEEAPIPELSDQEEVKEDTRTAELDAREAEIARREAEIAQKEAEGKFNQLLSEGKAIPAQKEAFIALSSLKNETVYLSDDNSKSVDVLLSEIFDAMPDMRLLSEDGEATGADEQELTDEELAHIEKYRLNKEDYINAKKENL